VIGNVVQVMRIAAGEIEDIIPDDGKDPAAKALGKKGALGRASVNSGAANQRSPNDVDPFHKIPGHEERRT
jgi:hypothetical protein